MNILVIGSGAREDAIVWKCLQSELVDRIFCAPGNAGIEMVAHCVNIDVMDFEKLAEFAKGNLGDDGLTIVGSDNPLAGGIVDYFEERGLLILGPTKQAALIESSKVFCKNFISSGGIPTGAYEVFTFADNAKRYVRKNTPPFVIKRDELAYGKGVVIAKNIEEADVAIDNFLLGENASQMILIEEFLEGWECSFIVLTDGVDYVPFPVSQDYKPLYQGGPNTGGMGAYTPVSEFTPALHEEICRDIIKPIIDALRENWRHPFKGFLYAGLMVTPEGPKVLEFNARLGDPEAQAILPLLKSDFVELCLAAAQERLAEVKDSVRWSNDALVNVVMASPGYPDKPRTGYRIHGLEDAAKEGVLVFHAGTKKNPRINPRDFPKILTAGGRVLSVVGRGETVEKAREMAYRGVACLRFGNKKNPLEVYRDDISL